MENTIQHPCHHHPLRRIDLTPGTNYSFRCCLCHHKIKGAESAYCCSACRLFFHTRCVESPPLINNHPFHPQHPLALSHGVQQPFVCGACLLRRSSGSAYACEGCGFHLGLACAMTILPKEGCLDEWEKAGATPELEYAGHEHLLMGFYAKSRIRNKCSACKKKIRGEAYCCLACRFFLHEKCVDFPGTSAKNEEEEPLDNSEEKNESMPEVIEHPFHARHPLSLFIGQSPGHGIKCSVCEVNCRLALADSQEEVHASYSCNQCDFYLDMMCATAVVPQMSSGVDSVQISHEHQLAHFFTKEEIFVKCVVCNTQISSEFSGCPDCRFFLHKDCVGTPETFEYSLHPEHRLTLSMIRQERSFGGARRCLSCACPLHNQLVYGCCECDFAIHVECARGTQAYDEKGGSAKVMLSWHEHPLTCFYAKTGIGSSCSVCKEEVQGEGCCCLACKVFLHRRCLEPPETSVNSKDDESPAEKAVGQNVFPVVIEHPFHSQHPLSLVTGCPAGKKCSICKVDCHLLSADSSKEEELHATYICNQCNFCLGMTCATNVVPPTAVRKRIPHISHEHQLANFYAKGETFISCVVCNTRIWGEFFGCPTCCIFLHKDCVSAPENFEYSLHPEHRLTLSMFAQKRSFSGPCRCRSCSRPLHNQLVYGCCECNFAIHIECARGMQAGQEKGDSAEIKLSWHEHPVHLSHRTNWPRESCSACGDYIQGLCYICSIDACKLILHEPCTGLTSEIQHQHHPNHALSLVPSASRKRYKCEACHEEIEGFYFSCSKCAFYLDTKCGSQFPDRKHVLHEHKIMRFEKIPSLECNVCCKSCDSEFYRCVACNFNIHLQCMELPRTVKPKAHFHTMVLYDFYIDDDSGEYYCDFCEKRRNPDLGVYLCEQCKLQSKLVAHIECALSKTVIQKKDDITEKSDQRVASLQKEVDEAKAKHEALMKELEDAKNERPTLPY